MQTQCGYRLHPYIKELRATELVTQTPVRLLRLSPIDCEFAAIRPLLRERREVVLGISHPAIESLRVPGHLVAHRAGREGVATSAMTVAWASCSRPQLSALARLLSQLRANNQAVEPAAAPALFEEVRAPGPQLHRLMYTLAQVSSRLSVRDSAGRVLATTMLPPRGFPLDSFSVDIETPYVDYLFALGPHVAAEPRRIHMVRLAERFYARTVAPPGLRVRAQHPLVPELCLVRDVIHVSERELTFRMEAAADLLFPGLAFPNLVVEWKGGSLNLAGVVRGLPESASEIGHLTITGGEHQEQWSTEVAQLCHPRTIVGWKNGHQLWQLLRESGYFGISNSTAESFADVRQPFLESNDVLASAPELGNRTVWTSGHRVRVSCSMLKIQSHGYVAYQLARTSERSLAEVGSHSVQEVMTHAVRRALGDEDFRWLIFQVKTDGPRLSRSCVDFASSRVQSGLFGDEIGVVKGQCFGVSCATALESPLGVETATAAEVASFEPLMRRRFPGPYIEALDLMDERFRLEPLSAAYAARGLYRRRSAFVAKRGSVPCALAVVDSASDGLHVFGLFDTVRIYSSQEACSTDAVRLLEAARHWFWGQGKKQFIWIDETDAPEKSYTGVKDLGQVDQAFISRRFVGEWLEEVACQTIPVEAFDERELDD